MRSYKKIDCEPQKHLDCNEYIYCGLIDGEEEVFRLSSWELGLEIAQNIGGMWVPIYDDPYMIVLGGSRKLTDSPYVESYFRRERSVSLEVRLHFKRTVPEDIQEIVGRQFRYSQVQLLKALRFCPELINLARSCPALFWLVVEKNSNVNVLQSSDFIRLVHSKRKEILRRLSYAGTQSALKLLSKISIDSFRDEDLFRLKDVMRSEEKISLLRHYKELSKTHFFAASNFPALLEYTFARNELMRRDTSWVSVKRLASLYKDTCNVAEALQKENIEKIFTTIRYVKQLAKLHDDLTAEMHADEANTSFLKNLLDTYGNTKFPTPPVPGTQAIQPICSLHELAREGKEMQNCILTYGQHIYERKFFCYKILMPERGTVGLELTKDSPKIAEIKLKNNKTPSSLTVRSVEVWLSYMITNSGDIHTY